MNVIWKIDYRKIIVTCECGWMHELDKEDLEDYINLTCRHCGRLITAGIDIGIYPAESNPKRGLINQQSETDEVTAYDLDQWAKESE